MDIKKKLCEHMLHVAYVNECQLFCDFPSSAFIKNQRHVHLFELVGVVR